MEERRGRGEDERGDEEREDLIKEEKEEEGMTKRR